MRILLAHNNYSVQGGAEVFYQEVGRVLTENGHEVAYFSCAEDGLKTDYSSYFPSSADYKTGSIVSRLLRFPGIIYNREAKAAFAKLIDDFRPDVIHAFAIYVRLTPSILDAAREAGVPVVLSCNDYKHICPNYKLFHHGRVCEECKGGRFKRALANRCCHDSTVISAASMVEAYVHDWLDIWKKNVNRFLFASDFMAHKTEEFWGRENFRFEMLRNPFDCNKFRLEGPVGEYLLFFGRLIDEKGVDVLLKAAEITPDVPVVIIGDGPDREIVEQLSNKLANVKFLGPKWGDDLNECLRSARAVVVPSLWHENFPYVIFQAFAAAKPVIGTNRGGIPELVIDEERGWIYEATDVEALADLFVKVSELSDEAISQMGKNAQSFVEEEFNDSAFYNRLMEIYKGVMI